MSYDGRAVANFILDFCDARRRPISNLALQKIVYFCHVWSLIRLNKPLVKHKFEAWEFGPVLPYLYREFKCYDALPIGVRARQIDYKTGKLCDVPMVFDENIQSLLCEVVEFYSRLRAGDLVELSHVQGGPWFKVWHHHSTVNPGMKIEDADIKQFYSSFSNPFIVQ